MGALVGLQGPPVVERHLPRLAFRRFRPARQIGEGLLVGRDQAGAGTAFDRHVANRHSPFHGERADGLARVFDDMAGSARRADLADDREDDVLRGHALRQDAVDAHQHVLGLALDERLGRQHMLDLARADAMRERAEGTMRRGVAVAANDRGAGQRESLLGSDHMHDALANIALVEIFDAEFACVPRERIHLRAALRVVDALGAIGGGDVVVDDRERLSRRMHLAVGKAQALEGLRGGDFVHQMPVDIEKAGAVLLRVDQMVVPDLVVKGARLHGISFKKSLLRAVFAGRHAPLLPGSRQSGKWPSSGSG